MTKEKFEKIKKDLEYKDGIWDHNLDINSIILSNGIGIYPNWKYLRFLFDENGLYIKHGNVYPYGARITSSFIISGDKRTIYFSFIKPGVIGISDGLGNRFRNPKIGDKLVVTNREGKISSEVFIVNVTADMRSLILELSEPINEGKFSFFDPSEFNNSEHLLHSYPFEGQYFSFKSNDSRRKHNKYGVYHEFIKVKNIEEINIQVGNNNNGKTYKITGGGLND